MLTSVRRWLAAPLIMIALILAAAVASAQEAGPVEFEADSVSVDQEQSVMTATGNVTVTNGGDILTADKLIYNQNTDIAQAYGNVVYRTAEGLEHRSDEMVLDENFTHAIATPIISMLGDGTRFSAVSGEHSKEKRTVFDRSRFSPCKCDYDKGESPIWDLRATTSLHDIQSATITHTNVSMHIFGLPVFYLPALAHPDWTVRRRSGVLTPSFAYSNDKGFTSTIPYYQVVSPTQDIEFQPTSFQFRGQAMRTRYRQLWDRSSLEADVIAGRLETFKQTREQVAAVDAHFETKIGQGWDVDVDIERSSQDTFLRRYSYDNRNALISGIRAERISDNRYYLIEASDYQGLKAEDTPDREPVVLPHIYYEKTSAGPRDNQKMRTELSLLQLDNDESHEMVRWTGLQSFSQSEHIMGGIAKFQVDGLATYYDIQRTDDSTDELQEFGQANVIGAIDWKRPIPMMIGTSPAILSPQAKFTAIGGSDRTDEVPNRDTADFRLDEANMFLSNRFQGRDYILPGSRVDVGSSLSSSSESFGSVTAFAGISYRTSGNPSKGLTSSGTERYSDYIASFDIETPFHIDLSWAGRADSETFEIEESRSTLGYNHSGTNLSVTHTQIAKAYFTSADDDKEEASISASQKLTDSLTIKADQVWDLSNTQTKRKQSTYSAVWTGGFQDCLTISLDYKRDPFADRDVKKVSELQLFLTFKYLGTISQSDLQN